MMRKIVTSPTHSPLPTRDHDFCAHYDGEEEAGNYGYGATPEAAIADFIENCQEGHDERLDPPVNLLTALRAKLDADNAATNQMLAHIAVIHADTAAMQAVMFPAPREGSDYQMEAAE